MYSGGLDKKLLKLQIQEGNLGPQLPIASVEGALGAPSRLPQSAEVLQWLCEPLCFAASEGCSALLVNQGKKCSLKRETVAQQLLENDMDVQCVKARGLQNPTDDVTPSSTTVDTKKCPKNEK